MTVTVVIPCYNQQSYLHDCLANLAKQKRRPDRVLIMDDGSQPALEVFATFGLSVDLFRLPRNGGVAYAMNVGLTQVQTDLVAFVAADDKPRPGWLDYAMDMLQFSKKDLFTAPIRFHDPKIKASWDFRTPGFYSGVWEPDDLRALSAKHPLNIASHTAVWKTEALKSFNGFPSQCLWHCDWWATYGFAFQHGLMYYDEVLSDVQISPIAYSAGMKGPIQGNVLKELFLLAKDNPLIWQTLGQHGWKMVRIIQQEAPIMLDGTLLRKAARRELELFARRLPGPIQRRLLAGR
jgi:glycosyltransferase involved in cell wall biosynthesis